MKLANRTLLFVQSWVQCLKECRPLYKLSSILLIFLCLALFASANPEPQGSSQTGAAVPATQADAAAKPVPAPMPAAPAANAQPNTSKPADMKTTSPSAPFDSGTVINVHTRLVTIDVVATDGKGHAVT